MFGCSISSRLPRLGARTPAFCCVLLFYSALLCEVPPPPPPRAGHKQNRLMVQTTACFLQISFGCLCAQEIQRRVHRRQVVVLELIRRSVLLSQPPHQTPQARQASQQRQLGCWYVSFASIPISRFHPPLLLGLSWWLIVTRSCFTLAGKSFAGETKNVF